MDTNKKLENQTVNNTNRPIKGKGGFLNEYRLLFVCVAYFFSLNLTYGYGGEGLSFIIALVMILLAYKPMGNDANGAVRLMGKGYALLVVSYLAMGLLHGLLPRFLHLLSAIPVVWAVWNFARNCEKIEKSVMVFGLFKFQYIGMITPLVWILVDAGQDSYDVYHYAFFPFALVSAFALAIGFQQSQSMIVALTGETYELPENTIMVHPIPMTRAILITVVLSVVVNLCISLADDFIRSSIHEFDFWNTLNKKMQTFLFPLLIAIIYILVYPFISKQVIKGRKDDKELHRRPINNLVIALLSGIVSFIGISYSSVAGVKVMCAVPIMTSMCTYYFTMDPAIRIRSTLLTALTTVVGLLGGLCVIPVLIVIFLFYAVLYAFFHYGIHDMFTFGHGIQFWDNHGDFHILNTVTMTDESGRRWRWV